MPKRRSILYVGHCYYNHYYLAKELRKLGWRADVLNIDLSSDSQMYYHGQDYTVAPPSLVGHIKNFLFFIKAFWRYDIFHFGNAELLTFPPFNQIRGFYRIFGKYAEVRLLRAFGKKIFYTNNGCRDGVTQSAFKKWGPESVCDSCPWRDNQNVCSDKKNAEWGELRNRYTDYIGLLGGNRADYNVTEKAHEAPWIYCLDSNFWRPDLVIPANYRLSLRENSIKIFHSVGNYDSRSHGERNRTIKSTEIWFEIVEILKEEGLDVELIFFKDVPNKVMRYYQAQADIFVEMLTFGWFGANVREAMMLGKPAICFLRPEWLEQMGQEYPEYVANLPVISATPETAYSRLRELVVDEIKRKDVGRRMREFGLSWHASDVCALVGQEVYLAHL